MMVSDPEFLLFIKNTNYIQQSATGVQNDNLQKMNSCTINCTLIMLINKVSKHRLISRIRILLDFLISNVDINRS